MMAGAAIARAASVVALTLVAAICNPPVIEVRTVHSYGEGRGGVEMILANIGEKVGKINNEHSPAVPREPMSH
jgi:hypothetical protein